MTERFSSKELAGLLERGAKPRAAFEAIEEAALLPAAPRVARRLLLMAGGYGEPGALRCVLKVPQEDLAMMLALSRQTINQVLMHFETQGALKLRYAEIEIVDADMLREQSLVERI
ncbi:CRP-like cAMP-binding protein [Paraburkholderia sp. WSM4175]